MPVSGPLAPSTVRPLVGGFLDAARRFPERPAVEIGADSRTYAELRDQASALAATLDAAAPAGDVPLTCVFAHRTFTAYAGLLAALMRGHGYMPLNRTVPPVKSRGMLERSGCSALIVDEASSEQLGELLEGLDRDLVLIMPETEDVGEFAARWPRHRFVGAADLHAPGERDAPAIAPDALAYLLFTSGSTGVPKGVMVAQRNVAAFVDAMVERYGVTEQDRFSQMFDLTFDLSAFDMFVAWERGACVCCPTEREVVKPDGYVTGKRLTIWLSVPTTGIFLRRMRALKPGAFPTLRWSAFCGEALPVEVARAWAEATPNGTVENIYGPTELTIACTAYRWDGERSEAEAEIGIVPIGWPLGAMEAIVVDDDLKEVPPGGEGELLLTGPQMTLGYWKDPERTAQAFVRPAGKHATYYRTGDRVRRPRGDSPLTFLGRRDHQIKIAGHRIELGEVEAALREVSGVEVVAAVGWPRTESGFAGIVAFVGDPSLDGGELRRELAERLPRYMLPRIVRVLDALPLTDNGKTDRKALVALLEGEE